MHVSCVTINITFGVEHHDGLPANFDQFIALKLDFGLLEEFLDVHHPRHRGGDLERHDFVVHVVERSSQDVAVGQAERWKQ